MKQDSARLEPIVDEAVKTIKSCLEGGMNEEGDDVRVVTARSVLGTWAKLRQSEHASEGLYFAMAKSLAQDGDQLKRYLEVTMPEVPLIKVLEAKRLPEGKKK